LLKVGPSGLESCKLIVKGVRYDLFSLLAKMLSDKLYSTVSCLMGKAVSVCYGIPEVDSTQNPTLSAVVLELSPSGYDILQVFFGCDS